MTERNAPAAEGGFALVETLVAAAIIAGVTGLLFQTIASDARATEQLRERRRAAMLAQTALDEATSAAASPLGGGQWQGMTWRVRRAPYGQRDSGASLERITVRVAEAASGRALVTLDTLRLVR